MRGTRAIFRSDERGVTLPELMVGLAVIAIASAFSFGSFQQYRESTTTARAIQVIRADVTLARSLAIRGRESISLVANETRRSYVIRDGLGNVHQERIFDLNSDIRLTGLDVLTTGDSLTFDSRGVLITGAGTRIDATRSAKTRSVTFNALGRSRID